MRKSALFFIVSIIILSSLLCISCKPKPERIYSVGDTWSNNNVNIKLNSFEFSFNENESVVNLELTFNINTTSELIINDNGLYVYTSVDNKIYTLTDKNEEENGYNIFKESITEEINYTFFFDLPLNCFTDENGELITGLWGIRCFISPANFYITVEI